MLLDVLGDDEAECWTAVAEEEKENTEGHTCKTKTVMTIDEKEL